MLVDVPCTKGRLQVTEQGVLQVKAPFNRMIWQVACADITGFTTHPGAMLTVNVTVHVGQAEYKVEMVTKANFEKVKMYFPHLQTDATPDYAWYHDKTKRTHVATYTHELLMRRDVEEAVKNGWMIQGQSGMSGHIQVGPTMTAAVLTGGWSLLLGASRTKDSVTFTYVRTPEWLAQNKTNP